MTIKNMETLNVRLGKTASAVELMTLSDSINIELEIDAEFFNVFLDEAKARQVRDWLIEALPEIGANNV